MDAQSDAVLRKIIATREHAERTLLVTLILGTVATGLHVVMVAWRIRAYYRTRQWRPGLCRKCLYDLTANVSGTCPECGASTSDKPPIEDDILDVEQIKSRKRS